MSLPTHDRQLDAMANQYGNLGDVYKSRGDLKTARQHWITSRDLYARIGMPQMVKKLQDLLDSLPPP